MGTASVAETDRAGTSRGRAWLFPAIIAGLLSLNVGIVVVTAIAAKRSEMPGERDLRVLERAAALGGAARAPTSLTNPVENTRGPTEPPGARP
jgi:hypothetical protein